MDPIEISHNEYAELQKRPSQEEFAAEKRRADEAVEALGEIKPKLETAEAAQKAAEEGKEAAEKKLKEADEEKAQVTLRDERLGKLGDGFMAKLGDTTKANLKEDAGKMEDEAWEKRLSEVEELASVKRDLKLDPKAAEGDAISQAAGKKAGADEFSQEEVASSAAGDLGGGSNSNGGSPDGDPTVHERRSVARGLLGGKPAAKSDD